MSLAVQKDALYQLLVADPPLLDMRSKLGPQLCTHVKQVDPGHLMAIHAFWMPLIKSGCKKMVLQSKTIWQTLHSLANENNILIQADTKPLIVPVVIDAVKQRVMQCAAMMRALKNEGWQYSLLGISKPMHTSSSVKSRLTGAHLAVLGPILQTWTSQRWL